MPQNCLKYPSRAWLDTCMALEAIIGWVYRVVTRFARAYKLRFCYLIAMTCWRDSYLWLGIVQYQPFYKGVAIAYRGVKLDAWWLMVVKNGSHYIYRTLTVGCLHSIVREFWTWQWIFLPTSVPNTSLREETRTFFRFPRKRAHPIMSDQFIKVCVYYFK